MLVRAFDDDPVSNYMFAGRRRRHFGLHSFFTSELRHNYIPHHQVYVTEDLSGASSSCQPLPSSSAPTRSAR
jgi:hypothetical protein